MTVLHQARVHVRWLIRRDFPEVIAIDQSNYHSWDEEQFLEFLRRRHSIGMVAEYCGRIVGFMVYEMHEKRIQLFKLVTHPLFRRQGVGQQMAWKLANKLSSHRRTRIEIMERESNLAGHLFLKAQGFRATEVSREIFPDTGEDGYTFSYCLDEPACVGGAA